MDKIILFEDGSWEWEPLSAIKLNSTKMKFIVLTIGYNWLDSEVSRMVKDYYYDGNLSWAFDQ